mmetsp:Transcript_8587/g.18717  ORF Transcript_8587/g.18717 Transcript_8587/m.18717 type:complete len:371 (-) Transcript_8587:1802-2914(-)
MGVPGHPARGLPGQCVVSLVPLVSLVLVLALLLAARRLLLLIHAHLGRLPLARLLAVAAALRGGLEGVQQRGGGGGRGDGDVLRRGEGHAQALLPPARLPVGGDLQQRAEPVVAHASGDAEGHLVHGEPEGRHDVGRQHLPLVAPAHACGVHGDEAVGALGDEEDGSRRQGDLSEADDALGHGRPLLALAQRVHPHDHGGHGPDNLHLVQGLPGRVRLLEQLAGDLPELGYLADVLLVQAGLLFLQVLEVHGVLVGEVVVHVARADRRLVSVQVRRPLLVAEYEVDPVVQVQRDVLGLQCLPVLLDEILGILGPRGQHDIPHLYVVLGDPEVHAVDVLQHVWRVEQLGHELFDVCGVGGAALVGRLEAVE